jgi:hypothetical protein
VLVAAAACGGPGAADFPTATELPDDDRRPDAIAVDLPSEPPPSQDQAQADQHIVALRTPLGMQAARDTVQAFFRAVVQEDMSALSKLLRSGTMVQTARAGAGPTKEQEALSWWRQRFRKHEYDKLAARVLYRDGDIETFRSDRFGALPVAVRRPAPASRSSVPQTDLVLRIPIVTHSIRSERLLGDELFLWLERVDDRYVITHMAEPGPL